MTTTIGAARPLDRITTRITPTLRVEGYEVWVRILVPISASSVVRVDWAVGAGSLA
jgi:hypothetical protein